MFPYSNLQTSYAVMPVPLLQRKLFAKKLTCVLLPNTWRHHPRFSQLLRFSSVHFPRFRRPSEGSENLPSRSNIFLHEKLTASFCISQQLHFLPLSLEVYQAFQKFALLLAAPFPHGKLTMSFRQTSNHATVITVAQASHERQNRPRRGPAAGPRVCRETEEAKRAVRR